MCSLIMIVYIVYMQSHVYIYIYIYTYNQYISISHKYDTKFQDMIRYKPRPYY